MKPISKLSSPELKHEIEKFSWRCNDEIRANIMKAMELSEEFHKGQMRPDGPHFKHALRAAVRCIQWGATDPDEIIAALLHDVPEDQSKRVVACFESVYSYAFSKNDSIIARSLIIFGEMFNLKVMLNLTYLTNPDMNGLDSFTRNLIYTTHVEEIIKSGQFCSRIKLADFFDNGLNLASIEDERIRKKLCAKYITVFPMFIEAVKENRINVSGSKVQVLLELGNAYDYVQKQLS